MNAEWTPCCFCEHYHRETYGPNDEYVNCLNKYAISMVTSAKTIIPAEEGET